jgi:hypothetical protein
MTRAPIRADEADDDFIESYGLGVAIGSYTAPSHKAPEGWSPPKREFPIGFHCAAPGPSHPDYDEMPAPVKAPRKAAKAPAGRKPAAPRRKAKAP